MKEAATGRWGRRGEQTGGREGEGRTKDTEGRAIFLKNIPQTVAREQEGEETRR